MVKPVLGNDDREDLIEDKVFQIAEDYGLNIEEELDEVGVKYLGTYVNAETSRKGPKMRVDFDSTNFFNMPEERQRRTILHELIHIKQFNNSLDEWARSEFNVSEDFAEKLDGTIWEGVKSVEGETELILSSFFPEEDSSYPYAQSTKKRELESLGLDIDSEITESIEDEAEEILDEYHEIDSIKTEENIYMEEGSIGDLNYSVAFMGKEVGEKESEKVEEYLKSEISEAIKYGSDTGIEYSAESRDYGSIGV